MKIKLGKYKHFKGGEYEVLGVAKHSETLEEFAVYKHITGKREGEKYFWVRPVKMFLEKVKIGNKKVQRFQRIKI